MQFFLNFQYLLMIKFTFYLLKVLLDIFNLLYLNLKIDEMDLFSFGRFLSRGAKWKNSARQLLRSSRAQMRSVRAHVALSLRSRPTHVALKHPEEW